MDRETFERISYPLARLYEQLSLELQKTLIRRLSMHREISGTIEWELKLLAEFGHFHRDIEHIMQQFEGVVWEELRGMLSEAAREALRETEPLYERLPGKEQLVPAAMSSRLQEIYAGYYRQAANKLNLTNTTMLHGAEQSYWNTLNRVALSVKTGQTTRVQALKEAIREMNRNGLPALVDQAGRRWSPEGYVNMVIRTATGNVYRETIRGRMEDWGEDLFYISAHRGARPLCEPYQGLLCSWSGRGGVTQDIDGEKIRFIPLSATSYGEPAGIFGINCGHYPLPFIPGISRKREPPDEETRAENERVYRESQHQRAIERRIRYWKGRVELATVSGDPEDLAHAKKWLGRARADMDTFIDRTGRSRRADREQIYAVRAA